MLYFYILLFYTSSIFLEIQYLRNKISTKFLFSFLISFCYSNIYILNENYFKENIIYAENPFLLFFYFFIFIIIFYSSIIYFLFYYIQTYEHMNSIYFIEN